MILPQHDPLALKHFLHSLVYGHVKKYSRTTHVLGPFSLTSMSSNTSTLISLHLKSNGFFPFFLEDYKLEQHLKLSSNSFKLAFQLMSHLSASTLSKMVLNISGLFSPKRFCKWILGFVSMLFSYRTRSHSMLKCTCPLGGLPFSHDQALSGIHFITMGDALYDSQVALYAFNFAMYLQHIFFYINLK
jgi:hypothetical protein